MTELDSNVGIEDIQNFYNSDALHKFNSLLIRQSFLEICKKRTSENVHSAILKWLFENDEFARLPLSPLVTFLRLIATKANDDEIKSALRTDILTGKIKSVKDVHGEVEVTTKNKRRVDIVLTFETNTGIKCRICIENKLYTCEHDNQCAEYYNHYTKLNDGYNNIFVFLSPDSSNKTDTPHYVNITYQDLYDSVLYPLYTNYREHHSERSIAFLKEYIETLTSISEDYKPIVMSKEYQELLKEIYENHRDLFFAAIEYAGTEEDKKTISQATGGNISYEISYNNERHQTVRGYTKMARNVIETLLNNGITADDLEKELSTVNIQNFDNRIISVGTIVGSKTRYSNKEIESSGKSIYVSNQWCENKAEAFISLVHTKYRNIKISKLKKDNE